MIPVRSAIPGYAGFGDVAARRLTDQQVRAWVGERLAALGERLPMGDATASFDDLIFHCEFGNQHVIKAFDDAHFDEPAHLAAVEAGDARLITAAAEADTVDAAGLAAFLARVRDALHRRNETILARD